MRVTLLNLYLNHGGAETCVRGLFNGLQRRGHETRLLLGRLPSSERHRSDSISLLPRFFPEFAVQRLLSRLAGLTDTMMLLPLWHVCRHPDLIQADIVHCHTLNGSYFNIWALPLLARSTPLVITLHDMWLMTGDCDHSESCDRWQHQCGVCPMMRRPRGKRNSVGWGDLTRLNLALKRRAFGNIPPNRLTVVSPSRWLAAQAAISHLGRFPIEVIANGVDLTTFTPHDRREARQQHGLPLDECLFLATAGNWSNPHKGGNHLAELANGLRQSQLGKLVVIGNVPPGMSEELGRAGALLLAGFQNPAAMPHLYSACDATLLLSRNENFPYVVSESLACGCPVIARAVGGVPEMVEEGVTGWLLPADAGVPAFLEAARRFRQATPLDRERLRRAARAAAQKQFSLTRMTMEYERVYSQMREGQARFRFAGKASSGSSPRFLSRNNSKTG